MSGLRWRLQVVQLLHRRQLSRCWRMRLRSVVVKFSPFQAAVSRIWANREQNRRPSRAYTTAPKPSTTAFLMSLASRPRPPSLRAEPQAACLAAPR